MYVKPATLDVNLPQKQTRGGVIMFALTRLEAEKVDFSCEYIRCFSEFQGFLSSGKIQLPFMYSQEGRRVIIIIFPT